MSDEVGLVIEGDLREDAADRVKPWTVKGIAPEERNAAIAAADRQDMTIGEWLSRAIRAQVQADQRSDRLDRQTWSVVELAKTLAANGKPIPTGITRDANARMRQQERATGRHIDNQNYR